MGALGWTEPTLAVWLRPPGGQAGEEEERGWSPRTSVLPQQLEHEQEPGQKAPFSQPRFDPPVTVQSHYAIQIAWLQ